MALITRLDGRTDKNNSFQVKDSEGEIVVEVTVVSRAGSTIEINTQYGMYVEKPNGWVNKKRVEDS